MAFNNPTIDDFKSFFVRDFPYGSDQNTSILDSDIGTAYQMVNAIINQDLFSTQDIYNIGYYLLSAHYLVMNIQGSSQGISSQFDWMTTNKSVGSVSEGFQIPQRILDNPEFSWLTKTSYGARYLMMILPQLSGQVWNAYGDTLP